jgi:hypothetical protein
VKAGQLLAEIAAPDVDQQVAQARAQVLQARGSLRQAVAALEEGHANQSLAQVTATRWAALLKRGAVSKQDKGGKDTKDKGKKKETDDHKEKVQALKQQQEPPTFTVHLAPVTVGRDYGNAIEILTGLQGNERIIANPNDHVQENPKVKGAKAKNNPIHPQRLPGQQTGRQ